MAQTKCSLQMVRAQGLPGQVLRLHGACRHAEAPLPHEMCGSGTWGSEPRVEAHLHSFTLPPAVSKKCQFPDTMLGAIILPILNFWPVGWPKREGYILFASFQTFVGHLCYF